MGGATPSSPPSSSTPVTRVLSERPAIRGLLISAATPKGDSQGSVFAFAEAHDVHTKQFIDRNKNEQPYISNKG